MTKTELFIYLHSSCCPGDIEIFVDNEVAGSLSTICTEPTCGGDDGITIEVEPGTHSITASCSDPSIVIPGTTVSLDEGFCYKLAIGCGK